MIEKSMCDIVDIDFMTEITADMTPALNCYSTFPASMYTARATTPTTHLYLTCFHFFPISF